MPTGHYRFRRSLGNVSSNFRGARPDTYPLLSYVLQNRALDLSNVGSLTISDISGNGNDATLYTGIYVSTNGTTDKAIVADASAAGSGNYYLTGKIKPSGTTQAKATIDGSALNLSGLTADVWQDFTTTTKTSVTPDTVAVGWNGGGNYSAAEWSDVRLIDASDDSVVARWKLYDSAAASLGGYPTLDCVGGYHGAHVGCAGGSAESYILQTAGEDFNKRMWFDGVNDYVEWPIVRAGKTDIDIHAKVLVSPNSNGFVLFSGSNGGLFIGIGQEGSASTGISTAGGTITVDGITMATRGDVYTALADGEVHDFVATGVNITSFASDQMRFGFWSSASLYMEGTASDIIIYDSDGTTKLHEWQGYGNTNADWVDLVGSVNGTVNGSPSLYHVAESETTAGQDALGTAIENPRLNSRVLNLTTGTGYGRVSDSVDFKFTSGGFSLECACYIEPQDASVRPYFGRAVAGAAQGRYMILRNAAGDIIAFVADSGGTKVTSLTSYPSTGWHILTAVVDDTDIRLYIDGVLGSTPTAHNNTWTSPSLDVQIGVLPVPPENYTPPNAFASAGVGSCKIYSRALTAEEALKNYNAQKSAYGL